MKFGPVAVAEAEGAILAHSLRVGGARLRKGQTLKPADLARLHEAGLTEVTVARLDPGDMHEDDAALALATALQGGGRDIAFTAPFTGRVNLIAESPGVAVLDVGRINAANAVDPMVTIATVAPFHQVHPGGMLATVKIISYAVDGKAVRAAADAAVGAVRLARPIHDTASLIMTRIPGGSPEKGATAIETRLKALGMDLLETRTVAHEEDTLARAIAAARGDIVLILTGSATSDPADTAPVALGRAGGRVERFGMPVDPGNLLFLGDLAGKPVIGLPGSARSPVLHGADWVLGRVACGIPVTSADIAAMGVGGLLKEIPTRPQPRERRQKS